MRRRELAQDQSPETQDRLLARLVPQPLALFTTPVSAPGLAQLKTRKSYLLFAALLRILPTMTRRLTAGVTETHSTDSEGLILFQQKWR